MGGLGKGQRSLCLETKVKCIFTFDLSGFKLQQMKKPLTP